MVVLQRWLFQKNLLYTVHITSFHFNRQFRVASEPNELKMCVLGLLEEAGVPGGTHGDTGRNMQNGIFLLRGVSRVSSGRWRVCFCMRWCVAQSKGQLKTALLHHSKGESAYWLPWLQQTHHTGVLSHSLRHLQLVWKDTPTGWHLVRYMPTSMRKFLWFRSETEWPCTAAVSARISTTEVSLICLSNVKQTPFLICHNCARVPLLAPLPAYGGKKAGSNCCKLPLKAPEDAGEEHRKWAQAAPLLRR